MENPCCWVVLIFIAFLPEPMYCQEIHLNDLRRRDCTKLETNGLVDTFFSYFFNATVKLNKQLEDYTIVQFEILRKNSKGYSFLFDVSIAYECSGLKLETNHHCKKVGDGIFNIDVSLRNETGDLIRGQVIHYNKTVLATDVKVLSGANEVSDANGVLKINGQNMSSDMNCTRTIDVTGLIVEFECSNPDSPCVIEVKVDDTIVINQNTDRAVFVEQIENGRETLLEIKYATCSLNGKVNTLRCFIKTAFKETATEGGLMADNVIIISVAVTVSAIILIVLICILLMKRHKRQKHKKNKNDEIVEHTEVNQSFLEEKTSKQELDETNEDEKSIEFALDMDIFSAAKNGHFNIVQEIINTNPTCIDVQDNEGYTALMHAAEQGNDKIAKLLIEKEANICIKDSNDMTALMISCEKGHEGIEQMLIDRMVSIKGMNVLYASPQDNVKEFINDTNKHGMTPLIMASRGCHDTCVHRLIDYKADVNHKDNYGFTALMYACLYGYELVARALIIGHADVNIKNDLGKTCLEIATDNGHEDMLKSCLSITC